MRFDNISIPAAASEYPNLISKIRELNKIRNNTEMNINEINILTNDVIIEQNNAILDLLVDIYGQLKRMDEI